MAYPYQVLPNNLGSILGKIRKITARPSPSQISDQDLIAYINTFYVYDMSEQLRLESLRYNYQFTTTANIPVYDMPTDVYLTAMPPVFIGGYQSYMTQSRTNFFRVNPQLNFLQQSVYTANGTSGPYTGQFLTNTPIIPGFKTNPPGAYTGVTNDIQTQFINWYVLVSTLGAPDPVSGVAPSISLVDDGMGNLVNPTDPFNPATAFAPNPTSYQMWGSINYMTGAININTFVDKNNVAVAIPSGNAINVQYVPYVASRPQSVVFYQDQFIVYPVPDQAYTISFEVYKYPASFYLDSAGNPIYSLVPQLNEWWQLLAYGAADKIFADNADFENMQKFRPLLDEQMRLALRRTLVQQTSERTSTIYTEQTGFNQFPFGNLFTGF